MSVVLYVLIFILLLTGSAIFSGSETAFFSLTKSDAEQFTSESAGKNRLIGFLLNHPQKLLTTIIIGNTFINIAVASISAFLTHDFALEEGLSPELVAILDILVVTFVILILSEILPKIIALRKNVTFIKRFGILIWGVFWLFYPVTWFINKFVGGIAQKIKRRTGQTILSENELKTLMEFGEEHGELAKEEKEMIISIFEFHETTVKEVMVPRTDMVAFNIRDSFEDLSKLIKRTHFSRIPIYDKKIDNIIGILYVKDLLPILALRPDEKIDIRSLLRSTYFVPEQKNIDSLLREFQNEKIHIAIVVDEYGGIAGLVTLEDILEEIVGEIQDEFDSEKPLIRKLSPNSWMVSGKAPLEEISETLGIELPEIEDVETVGGLILWIKGAIPKQGDRIQYKNLLFKIEKATRQRIIDVKMELVETTEKDEPENDG
jgi:gliding motility-associated protein GldE